MTQQLTASDLLIFIKSLSLSKSYLYPSGNSYVRITAINEPDGPISVETASADDTETWRRGSISANSLERLARALRPYHPVQIDNVFNSSGNTRQALEALLAHTPHFFMCYPGRVDAYTDEIVTGVKHIMWCPDDSHTTGEIEYKDTDIVITESEVYYEKIDVDPSTLGKEFDNIDIKRMHLRMQIALLHIGARLGYRTWIARNDKIVKYGDGKIQDLAGAIKELTDSRIFFTQEIRDRVEFIDCVWVNERNNTIPAVIEVEHSTGVRSGLTRMLKLKEQFGLISNFVIVAPNKIKRTVVNECNEDIFTSLNAKYMSYTNVQILYGLLQKYDLKNAVTDEFVYAFMEEVKR